MDDIEMATGEYSPETQRIELEAAGGEYSLAHTFSKEEEEELLREHSLERTVEESKARELLSGAATGQIPLSMEELLKKVEKLKKDLAEAHDLSDKMRRERDRYFAELEQLNQEQLERERRAKAVAFREQRARTAIATASSDMATAREWRDSRDDGEKGDSSLLRHVDMSFFSKGIFTLDGSTVALVFTLTYIFSFFLRMLYPKESYELVYYIGCLLVNIITFLAIVKREKSILNICFFVQLLHCFLYTIYIVIAISASFIHPIDDLSHELINHNVEIGYGLRKYIHGVNECFLTYLVASWSGWFIYLCALNAVWMECNKSQRAPIRIPNL